MPLPTRGPVGPSVASHPSVLNRLWAVAVGLLFATVVFALWTLLGPVAFLLLVIAAILLFK